MSDTAKLIEQARKFLEQEYDKLLLASRLGLKHIELSFAQLSSFDPELASELLDKPAEIIRVFQLALQQFDIDVDAQKFHFRFKQLPQTEKHLIRNLRAQHIGKLLCLEGIVRQKSDVRPKVISIVYECPKCGESTAPIKQIDEKVRKPVRCSKCGYKDSTWRALSSDMIDYQGIVLEEITTDLEGGQQPKRLKLQLEEDLVSPMTDKRTNPGTAIRVVGVLKEVAKTSRDGSKLTTFDYVFEGNSIEPLAEDYTDIKISSEDEKKIMELAHDQNVVRKIVKSFAPGIYGHELVKEAILLQFVGGVQKKRSDGVKNRGDIHILLIGDPGSGKSQLLKRASVIAPKGRYVSGKGASGAGLTASVIKDEFLGGWSLEAGALVLANRGIAMIDELDKMTKEDTSAMHEALEQQTVTIAKANIQATLMCETTVLAAANPKLGRFDPFDSIAKQIQLPPALINRFDLIFPFRDIPSKEGDERLASFVLGMHQTSDTQKAEISTDLLRKFIIYARQNCHPKIDDDAMNHLKEYYVKMRNTNTSSEGMTAITLSARQLEALVRLTEASARLRLSPIADKTDAKKAIDLVQYYLGQIGVDPDTGKVDIDRITTGVTTSQRAKTISIREIIKDLEEKEGKQIPVERIIEEASKKGIAQDKVEEALDKFKLSGDLYEPKRGFISRVV
jgi:replicative DNA helicase Mcm